MALLRQEASTHGTIWNMVADLDLADEIRGISCPALIAGGDADVNTPTPVIKALSRALDDAPVEMIEGVGHFPLIEAPELFNAILGRFLEGLFTGAGAG